MKKSKLAVSIITAVLIFTVGIIFAIAEIKELNSFGNFKEHIPQDIFVKKQNEYMKLILNFLMLAIGGSLLSFSIIFRGFYFRNRLYDKVSAAIGLVAVFIVNFFVEFEGVWVIFTYLTIITTFDCIFIFTKEEFDSFIAKKAKNKNNNEKTK